MLTVLNPFVGCCNSITVTKPLHVTIQALDHLLFTTSSNYFQYVQLSDKLELFPVSEHKQATADQAHIPCVANSQKHTVQLQSVKRRIYVNMHTSTHTSYTYILIRLAHTITSAHFVYARWCTIGKTHVVDTVRCVRGTEKTQCTENQQSG